MAILNFVELLHGVLIIQFNSDHWLCYEALPSTRAPFYFYLLSYRLTKITTHQCKNVLESDDLQCFYHYRLLVDKGPLKESPSSKISHRCWYLHLIFTSRLVSHVSNFYDVLYMDSTSYKTLFHGIYVHVIFESDDNRRHVICGCKLFDC